MNNHSSGKGIFAHLIVHSLGAFGVEATRTNGTNDSIGAFHGSRQLPVMTTMLLTASTLW